MQHFVKNYTPWTLLLIMILVPLLAWLQLYSWDPPVNFLSVFPLLGLWAWLIMWTHYAYAALTLSRPNIFADNSRYYSSTGFVVLSLLLLHPGLLAIRQIQSRSTYPPDSFYGYVAQSSAIFITFGIISLAIFLLYEVAHRLKNKDITKKYWLWVSFSQVVAMTLVFFHGLSIGQIIMEGWARIFWVMMGVLLVPAMIIVVRQDVQKQREFTKTSNEHQVS